MSNRRHFLKTAATFAALAFVCELNLNSKLNIACVGVGGRSNASVQAVKGENIITLSDVNTDTLGAIGKQFLRVKTYQDFRKIFEKFGGKTDAVAVGTPDHTHAIVSAIAMKQGIHCYTEKPLAHSVG
ncbi:hypothetical protein FACS189454_00650 [Planctomycetales bacterium]|nr:hypothetical protein FACS189454_00650 [Planctomycetales bacterium]